MAERPWIEVAASRCLNVISIGKWLVDGQIPDGLGLDTFLEYYLMATPFGFDFVGVEKRRGHTIVVIGKGVQVAVYAFNPHTWLGRVERELRYPVSSRKLLLAIFDAVSSIAQWHEPQISSWVKGDDWKMDGALLLPDDEERINEIVARARARYPEPPEPVTEVTWSRKPYKRLRRL